MGVIQLINKEKPINEEDQNELRQLLPVIGTAIKNANEMHSILAIAQSNFNAYFYRFDWMC
jgi:hypothetical protein